MIKEHPDLERVSDCDIVWRYMSKDKFLKLLKQEAVYFCRIDKFDDKKEGKLTPYDKKVVFPRMTKADIERDRKRTYVSCWFRSPWENLTMWENYAKDGVAIKTTAKRLRDAFEKDKDLTQYLSPVRYVDFQKDGSSHYPGQIINMFHIGLTKQLDFMHEKEVRILMMDYDGHKKNQKGILVPVTLPALIEELWWSPFATEETKTEINSKLESLSLNLAPKDSKLKV